MTGYVACLPDDLDLYARPLPYLRLAHPRTGEPSLYLPYTPSSSEASSSRPSAILQICKLAPSKGRTWFIGDDTIQDGTMLLHTPIDPFFLVLPIILALLNPSATSREALVLQPDSSAPFQPLQDLVSQAALHPLLSLAPPFQPKADPKGKKPQAPAQVSGHNPDIERLLDIPDVAKVFGMLCERKVLGSNLPSPPPEGDETESSGGTTYYRPSTRAVLNVLKAKVDRLASKAVAARFDTLERQLARDGLTETSDETLLAQARTKMACDNLAQYLAPGVYASLLASYDWTLLEAHLDSKAAALSAAAQAAIASTAKKPTKAAAAAALKKTQGSRAVEALKKVDTRSMMKMTSFFKKREEGDSIVNTKRTTQVGKKADEEPAVKKTKR